MERLTQRDMDILKFAGRQRCVRPEHIEDRFDISRATAYRRLALLVDLGLLAGVDRVSPSGQVFAATREGLAATNKNLRPAEPTAWHLPHDEAMTAVVCALESQHVDCLTERELTAHSRIEQDDRYVFELMAERNRRPIRHRPDIVCEIPNANKFIAIEVELSPKNVDRWRDILRGFAHRVHVDGFIGVLYVVGPDARATRIAELARETSLGERFQIRPTCDPDLLDGLVSIVNADVPRPKKAAA